MALTVLTAAPDNWLTTLAKVKADLGIALSDTSRDAELEGLIQVVSDHFATEFAGRPLAMQQYLETAPGHDDIHMILGRWPISRGRIAPAVTLLDVAVTDVLVEDYDQGILFREAGFDLTCRSSWGIERIDLVSQPLYSYGITFWAGYDLPGHPDHADNAVAAKGTITLTGKPSLGEKLIIDTQEFTFVVARAATGEVTLGGDTAACVVNLLAAFAADLTTVTAAAGAGTTIVVTAVALGSSGNLIDFSESASNLTMNGSGHLGGTILGRGDVVDDLPSTYELGARLTVVNWANGGLSNPGDIRIKRVGDLTIHYFAGDGVTPAGEVVIPVKARPFLPKKRSF